MHNRNRVYTGFSLDVSILCYPFWNDYDNWEFLCDLFLIILGLLLQKKNIEMSFFFHVIYVKLFPTINLINF